jgi:hypothetical protein
MGKTINQIPYHFFFKKSTKQLYNISKVNNQNKN